MTRARRALPASVAIAIACGALVAFARGAAAKPAAPDAGAFRSIVRPMFQRAGCAGPTCHGSGSIGLKLSPSAADPRDLAAALSEIRAGDPQASPLYRKPLGEDHLGGRNIEPGSCEDRLLAGWIRGARDLRPCSVEPRPARIVPRGALPGGLRDLFAGCATRACHGGPAAPRLLDPARPGAVSVDVEALEPALDRTLPSRSRLLARLRGDGDHPRALAGEADPLYRELFAWIAGEPVVPATAPSLAAFAREVQPLLVRRGCTHTGCHGSGSADLVLFGRADTAIDDYLRLLPRLDDGLFPSKPQNLRPHGGGRRLGGLDDCVSARIAGWLAGGPPPPCTPRPEPDRARFAALVQPSLEKLTCPRCHEDEALGFRFIGHPGADDLEANFRSVLRNIDLEYPPVSSVLLRVREGCMQARLLAWIDRRPDPGCTVELANFRGSFPSRKK